MGLTQSDIALKLNNKGADVTKLFAYALAIQLNVITGDSFLPHDVEEDSFELSYNGEKYAGGSWYINEDNELVLASVTPQENFGKFKSSDEWMDMKVKLKEYFL